MRSGGRPHVGSAILAIALGGAAGHLFVLGGPFAWVVFWLLGSVLCPLLLCLVTPRHRLRNSVLANLAMLAIPALEGLALARVWPSPPGPNPPAASAPGLLTLAALSAFSVLLALAVVGAFESRGEA
jgi:hypothetical protein